jgi:predicted transcriptional regulator
MASRTQTYPVSLPDEVKQQVDAIARATERSPSLVIREAVELYIRDRAPSADIEDAIASAKSGIGHSSDQVFAWLDAWAAGDKQPLPDPDIIPRE